MQLNELLQAHTLDEISEKTKISRRNLKHLFQKEFKVLPKTKALGFISILQREYPLNLDVLKKEAQEYYEAHGEEEEIGIALANKQEGNPPSKFNFLPLLAVGLLAFATWYFVTQFDKKMLRSYLPFNGKSVQTDIVAEINGQSEGVTPDSGIAKPDIFTGQNRSKQIEKPLQIEDAITEIKSEVEKEKQVEEEAKSFEAIQPDDVKVKIVESSLVPAANTNTAIPKTDPRLYKKIEIVPDRRLWFGLVNVQTKKRKHYSVSKPFGLDLGRYSWLLATSSAPFSLYLDGQKSHYTDTREHYFLLDQKGIHELDKKTYVAKGGYRRW